jgi:hypothetical protein
MSDSDTLEINYIGYTYTFKKNCEDTLEDFHHISWLIAKQQPRTLKEFDKAHQLANIWYYQKKYKCGYSYILQNSIKDLDLLSLDL